MTRCAGPARQAVGHVQRSSCCRSLKCLGPSTLWSSRPTPRRLPGNDPTSVATLRPWGSYPSRLLLRLARLDLGRHSNSGANQTSLFNARLAPAVNSSKACAHVDERPDMIVASYCNCASQSISRRKSGCGNPATMTVVRAGYCPCMKYDSVDAVHFCKVAGTHKVHVGFHNAAPISPGGDQDTS